MIRTALRLAAIMALSNGGNSPWPTMAGEKVYDSRADFESLRAGDRRPILVVFTDDDGQQFRQGGVSLQARQIDLLIDLDIETGVTDPDSNDVIVGLPATTAELEAQLDLFEYQVMRALLHSVNPWADYFRKIVTIQEIDSARFSTMEGAERLAARQLRLRCSAASDCFPSIRVEDDPGSVRPTAEIPEPLKGLLDLIMAQASPSVVAATQPIVTALAAAAPEEQVLARFTGIDFRTAGPPDQAEQGDTSDDPGIRIKSQVNT